jgi:hypothetical protein
MGTNFGKVSLPLLAPFLAHEGHSVPTAEITSLASASASAGTPAWRSMQMERRNPKIGRDRLAEHPAVMRLQSLPRTSAIRSIAAPTSSSVVARPKPKRILSPRWSA